MEGNIDESKLSKEEFDWFLFQRYGHLIKNLAKEYSGDFLPEEGLSQKELDLVVVLTAFVKTPSVTPHAARRLTQRIADVKSNLNESAKTDRFKVALDGLSPKRVIDTLNSEIEKIETEQEKPNSKSERGTSQLLTYLESAKEVSQLAVSLEGQNF